jgi:hypothetical protein
MLDGARCADDHDQVRAQSGWWLEISEVKKGEIVETDSYGEMLEKGLKYCGGVLG